MRVPAMPFPSASRLTSTAMASAVCLPASDHDEECIYTQSSKGSTLITVLALQVRSDLEAGQKVVGVGSCGLDYLAVVAKYPEPDTKLRTKNLEVSLSQKWPNDLPAILRSISAKHSVCHAAMWRGGCYHKKMMRAELIQ